MIANDIKKYINKLVIAISNGRNLNRKRESMASVSKLITGC